MRPFLSPARVVILSLIDMYCSDVVSEEDDDFVLQLINCYVTDSYVRPANQRQRFLSRWQRAFMNIGLLSNVHSLRPALQTCFTAHSPSDLPLCITLWDDLVARLWLRLCTLDHMVPFFDNLHTYIALTYAEQRVQRELGIGDPPGAPMQLERRSPLGLLVYQSYIEFSRLSFAGRCELWEDFVRYRDPTRTDFKILWPHDYPLDQVLFDGVLSEYQGEWGTQTETIARVAFDRMLKDESVSASSDETDKLVALLIDRARKSSFKLSLFHSFLFFSFLFLSVFFILHYLMLTIVFFPQEPDFVRATLCARPPTGPSLAQLLSPPRSHSTV